MNVNYFVVYSLVFIFCQGLRLPLVFPKCHLPGPKRTDQEFSQCVIDASEKSRPAMIKGVPEWGFPSIKDFVIPSISIEHKARAISYNASMSDVLVKGLEDYKITRFLYDIRNQHMNITFYLEHLELSGKYKFSGKIFNEVLERSGPIKAALDKSSIFLNIEVTFNEKKGKKYAHFTYDFDLDFGKILGDLRELFGSNEVLNKAANAFIEDSADELVKNFIPDFKRALIDLISRLGDTIVGNTPYYEIFPRPQQ